MLCDDGLEFVIDVSARGIGTTIKHQAVEEFFLDSWSFDGWTDTHPWKVADGTDTFSWNVSDTLSETSVTKYQPTPRNIPQEHRPHL
jgi:uncharacterized protein YfeS